MIELISVDILKANEIKKSIYNKTRTSIVLQYTV